MNINVGYARVSTDEQLLDLQLDALKKYGCEKIYQEHISGGRGRKERPQLADCLSNIRSGDTLVVWRLDRLGRSLKDLIEIVGELDRLGVGLVSLRENIDTTSATGRLIFHVFASLAQFERELIQERTKAGVEAARARGRKGGRPQKLNDREKAMVRTLMADPKNSVQDIAKQFGVSRSMLYRVVREAQTLKSGGV
ncbi:recombinase family protein [uncultured Agitococcus sp.]|jgi:DNA invertase Pin-like site-specific DNA recombinase|uniref:recombinase family protein n=1 Tax=uncultured Agitococcus sp. TaxID=1506599 RepID=UPI00260A0D88|nr:recombinase family protein [uncultured Agitococcus sp.]